MGSFMELTVSQIENMILDLQFPEPKTVEEIQHRMAIG
jgi:hypothetical protein